jgi:hypothetical protein
MATEEPARRIRRESASRKSALDQERERIQETIDSYLFEAAEPGPIIEPRAYADVRTGSLGVVFPDKGIEGGEILRPEYCERLGAQLIRAARQCEAFETVISDRSIITDQEARDAHRQADNLAQRVLGNIEPMPGESPGDYGRRNDAAVVAFREAHPEWQPERFNRHVN